MLPDGRSANHPNDYFNWRSAAGDSIRLENALVAVVAVYGAFLTRAKDYNSRRPSNALAIVTSSAYSKSPPTGNPNARRVTRIPSGLIKRDKYRAVVSPSTFGLVATITSSTLPECN